MVINADNFHALQLLLYAYEGKVDVSYRSALQHRGRDWKYNNDYVDKTIRSGIEMAVDDSEAAETGEAAL